MAGDEKWKLGASFHHVCDLRNEMLGDDDDVLLTNNHVVQFLTLKLHRRIDYRTSGFPPLKGYLFRLEVHYWKLNLGHSSHRLPTHRLQIR